MLRLHKIEATRTTQVWLCSPFGIKRDRGEFFSNSRAITHVKVSLNVLSSPTQIWIFHYFIARVNGDHVEEAKDATENSIVFE